jgi:hypothetical protein
MFYLLLSTPGFANNMDNTFEFVLAIVMAYFALWGVLPLIAGLAMVVFADHMRKNGPRDRMVATVKRARMLSVIGWTLVGCAVPAWMVLVLPIAILVGAGYVVGRWVFPAIVALFRRSTWVRVVYGPVNG